VLELAMKSDDLGEATPEANMGQCLANLLMVEFIKLAKVLVQPEEDPQKRWKQLKEVNRELTQLRAANALDIRTGIRQKRWEWEEEDREEAAQEKHAEWVKQQRLAPYRLPLALAIRAHGKEDYEAAWNLAAHELEIEHDLPAGRLEWNRKGGYWYWDEEEEQWFWMAKAENQKSKDQAPKKHQKPGSMGKKAKKPNQKKCGKKTKEVESQKESQGSTEPRLTDEPSGDTDGAQGTASDEQPAGLAIPEVNSGPNRSDSNQFKPLSGSDTLCE
jgi:hypothetical protein